MNILIIEDDIFFANKIKDIFESKIITNRVDIISSLDTFLSKISILLSYDIILTDLKLWNLKNYQEWYDIIKIIRQKTLIIPIVVISWNDDIEGLRYAFECWANDYIIKPIRLKELEIRVLNWFKNHYLSNIHFLWNTRLYEDLLYNIESNEFFYKWKKIPLTKNNKYILSIFFANPDKILSENFLIEKIWWDFCNIVDRNLRVNILRLKKWLEPFWIHSRIKNIRWEWYLFKNY